MENIQLKVIGTIHSPYQDIRGMPIQPVAAQGVKGHIEILPEYREGLKDLGGFSHIILLYYFHQADTPRLSVTPFLDSRSRGVFATRAPTRPNPIGLSVVRLLGVNGERLEIENVDVLNGTPLLDIKPFVPEFDYNDDVKIGWLEAVKGKMAGKSSDERFGFC